MAVLQSIFQGPVPFVRTVKRPVRMAVYHTNVKFSVSMEDYYGIKEQEE